MSDSSPVEVSDPGRVAAIILNWRCPEDTIACVASVAGLDHDALDIMVCDNESGDGSLERIVAGIAAMLPEINEARVGRGLRPFAVTELAAGEAPPTASDPATGRLWIAATGRNGGYAFGNNVGIRLALTDPAVAHVWILNNDTVVDAGALRPLIAHMTADPKIAICGAKVLYLERPQEVQSLGGGRFLASRARCEQVGEGRSADATVDAGEIEAGLSYVNGAAAFVRRAFIEQVGVMDEGYFLYWEELDWATRAIAAGWRLGFCADAIVYHQVGAATGSNDHGLPSLASTYWMTRSKFRYLRLHRPALLAVAVPLLAKAVAVEGRHRRWDRAATMMRAAFGLPPRP